MIKYGVIKDKKFFEFLKKNLSLLFTIHDSLFTDVIHRCAEIKAEVVSKDEYETKGLRAILNFGHTFGHAIENLTGYKAMSHGQGVAIGMNLACNLGVKMGMFSAAEKEEVEKLLKNAGLPVGFDFKKYDFKKVLSVLSRDKKVIDASLRFVVPKKIGEVVVVKDVSLCLIKEVIGK